MNEDTDLHKTDFDAIYDQPDPRPYFATLETYDYAIPQHGADIFDRLLRECSTDRSRAPTVLDACCSYGIVGTLLTTDLDIGDIYRHYGSADVAALSHEELAAVDERLLRERRLPNAPRVFGLDVAKNAVEYAVAVGALDAGVAEDLERSDPSPELATMMSQVDLVTTTGGVGYVTERTFDRLLEPAPASTWVASFCLRTYDYAPIAQTLAERGLRTEQAAGTFAQRRFTGKDEQQWALAEVRSRGLDPTGKEEDGYYHAELYLSRPAHEVDERPLSRLLSELD